MATTADPISPVRGDRPELRIDAAPINNEPVELDGTPTTPSTLRARAEGSISEPTMITDEEKKVR